MQQQVNGRLFLILGSLMSPSYSKGLVLWGAQSPVGIELDSVSDYHTLVFRSVARYTTRVAGECYMLRHREHANSICCEM